MSELLTTRGQKRLCEALCGDGVALLTLEHAADAVQACYDSCRAFFELPLQAKARHGAGNGTGQQHGWMSMLDDDERAECFEAKLCYDRGYAWPSAALQSSIVAAFTPLHEAARACLNALCVALGMDVGVVHSYLDAAQPRLADCSHTAMRVWSYTGAPGGASGRCGVHVDNSLLTLAPAGSAVGLVVRHRCGGSSGGGEALSRPELQMRRGDVLVFAGDALGFLSAGRVRAPMHEVRCASDAAGPPRLSMPFFLRPRSGAVLDPAAASPGAPRASELRPLRTADLEANADGVRSRWPWKADEYYRGATWYKPGK